MFLMGPYISLYLLTENLKKLNSVYFYQMKWCMEKREYFGNISFSDRTDLDNQRDQPGEVEVKDPSHTSSVLIGTIECIGGDYKGGKITVNSGEELIIGRNSQISQIVLPDMDISRIHCSIRFSQTEHLYYVTDLSSYETTYLNDTIHIKKGQCIPCPLGSKLTLGNGKNQFILK